VRPLILAPVLELAATLIRNMISVSNSGCKSKKVISMWQCCDGGENCVHRLWSETGEKTLDIYKRVMCLILYRVPCPISP